MKEYNYLCFDCSLAFQTPEKPSISFENTYGEWEGLPCPHCEGNAKMIGHKTAVTVRVADTGPDLSRQHDIQQLEDRRKVAGTREKKMIDRSLNKIKKQQGNRLIKSMRGELSKAAKEGDWDRVNDIRDHVDSKRKYGKY